MQKKTDQRVRFHYLVSNFQLRNREALKGFILNLFRQERVALETLNYIFCSDEYLLNINQRYLKHNTYTDIITFELNEKSAPVLGEIYISIDRVRENAAAFATSFKEELHRVIFHGALHLAGYGDKRPGEKTIMTSKENFYLDQYLRST